MCSSRAGCFPGRTMGRRNFSPMAWYNKQIEKSPIITKSITSGILFGLGDVIAQVFIGEKGTPYDYKRTARAWIFGNFILGPLAHWHFNFLEFLVVRKMAVGAGMMPFVKMFFDQFTYWAPGINVIYLFSLAKLEGKSNDFAVSNVKERILPVLKANWMLWPIAQVINFKLVPLAHQLNFVLVVSLFWASYLSWFNGKQDQKRKLEQQKE